MTDPAHPACAQAPQRRDANGKVLGYRVTLSPRKRGRDPPSVCNTTHTHCNFSMPVGTRRVYLSAYNTAGESAATEVTLRERKGKGRTYLLELCPAPSSSSCQTGCCTLTPLPRRPFLGCITEGFLSRLLTECPARARSRAGSRLEGTGRGCCQCAPLSHHPGWLSTRRSAPGQDVGCTRG